MLSRKTTNRIKEINDSLAKVDKELSSKPSDGREITLLTQIRDLTIERYQLLNPQHSNKNSMQVNANV